MDENPYKAPEGAATSASPPAHEDPAASIPTDQRTYSFCQRTMVRSAVASALLSAFLGLGGGMLNSLFAMVAGAIGGAAAGWLLVRGVGPVTATIAFASIAGALGVIFGGIQGGIEGAAGASFVGIVVGAMVGLLFGTVWLLLRLNTAFAAGQRVMDLGARLPYRPCPNCGEVLGHKPAGKRTWKQVWRGGRTCGWCGCDVDVHGQTRAVGRPT